MLTPLFAYDAAGNIFATLDHMITRDTSGLVSGLIDFEVIEKAGTQMTTVWNVDGAAGSKVWPEWLGSRAHEFRVELAGPAGLKYISALVHRTSGYRRELSAIVAALAVRFAATPQGEPVDIRDIVGGPDRPLVLTDTGVTVIV